MTLLLEAGSFQRSSRQNDLVFRSLLRYAMVKVRFFFLVQAGSGAGSRVGAEAFVQVPAIPVSWCRR